MILFELPKNFKPDYKVDFEVFGPLGPRIEVRIQYVGPMPEKNKPLVPESFLYAIYQQRKQVECGRLTWHPGNGPITIPEVSKAIALQWNLNSPDLDDRGRRT